MRILPFANQQLSWKKQLAPNMSSLLEERLPLELSECLS